MMAAPGSFSPAGDFKISFFREALLISLDNVVGCCGEFLCSSERDTRARGEAGSKERRERERETQRADRSIRQIMDAAAMGEVFKKVPLANNKRHFRRKKTVCTVLECTYTCINN